MEKKIHPDCAIGKHQWQRFSGTPCCKRCQILESHFNNLTKASADNKKLNDAMGRLFGGRP